MPTFITQKYYHTAFSCKIIFVGFQKNKLKVSLHRGKSCHELIRQNILNDRSEITYFGRVKEITAYETVASILKLTVGDDVANNRMEIIFFCDRLSNKAALCNNPRS